MRVTAERQAGGPVKPSSLRFLRTQRRPSEAVSLLAEYGDEAGVLAGGQSLVPLMNLRLARPAVLVDINRIEDFGVSPARRRRGRPGRDRVGEAKRDADPDLARLAPLMTAALRHVGHPQNRARGTVVGSLAHHDPAAELPAVAVALELRR